MKFCPKCGNQLNENAVQCSNCGNILAGAKNMQGATVGQQMGQGMPNGNPNQMNQGMYNGNPQQMGQGMYNGNPQQMNQNPYNNQISKTQNNNSKLIIGISVAAVLGLILCLSIGYGSFALLCSVLISVLNTGSIGLIFGMLFYKEKSNERKSFLTGYLITFGVVIFIIFIICIVNLF